jgi:hypothetical protein
MDILNRLHLILVIIHNYHPNHNPFARELASSAAVGWGDYPLSQGTTARPGKFGR